MGCPPQVDVLYREDQNNPHMAVALRSHWGEVMFVYRVLAIAMLGLAGCATGPSKEEIAKELAGYELPNRPKPGEAVLYVVRPSEQARQFRLDVCVDGAEAHRPRAITSGVYYAAIPLEPGTHRVCASVYRPTRFDGPACRPVALMAGEVGFVEIDLIFERGGWNYFLNAIDEQDGKLKVKRIQEAHRRR